MNSKQLMFLLPILLVSLLVENVSAQSQPHQLRTMFTGKNKCLDIINRHLQESLNSCSEP